VGSILGNNAPSPLARAGVRPMQVGNKNHAVCYPYVPQKPYLPIIFYKIYGILIRYCIFDIHLLIP